MGKLDGRVALVTGAARGQGRSHALRLAQEGASIIAIDACTAIEDLHYPMPTQDDLEETTELVRAAGGRIHAAQADTRDLQGLTLALDRGVAEFGGLDTVVANAGVYPFGDEVHLTSARAWDTALGVNLTGTWHTCKAAVPHLIAGGAGGSVTIISSTAGLKGSRRSGAYSVSKHGLKGLMETLALELGPHRIRVNTVIPSATDTPMCLNDKVIGMFLPAIEGPSPEQVETAFRGVHALPVPWLDPVDISNAVVFLASDDARYVTGTQIKVDAGFSIT